MSPSAPPDEPHPDELVKELSEAWDTAKAQLQELREAVTLTGRMADLKQRALYLGRDRDEALRNLGAAVWSEVKKGRLSLPPALTQDFNAVEAVDRRQQAKAAEISDILLEGEEAANRQAARRKNLNSGVAPKPKKR